MEEKSPTSDVINRFPTSRLSALVVPQTYKAIIYHLEEMTFDVRTDFRCISRQTFAKAGSNLYVETLDAKPSYEPGV